MAEVIEIIEQLTLQVQGNEQLEKQINALNTQAKVIDELIKKRDLLSKYADKDKSPERAAQAKQEIDKLTQSIDKQTDALTRQVRATGILQKAIDEPIGKIQQLTEYISQATKEQATLTDPKKIKEYSEEIRAAQKELKALIEPIKQLNNVGAIEGLENRIKILKNTIKTVSVDDILPIRTELIKAEEELKKLNEIGIAPKTNEQNSILSQLFGISSASATGKQVLQGALSGLGIGVGFSVIPALTSSLIEYTKAMIDTVGQAERTIKANDALAQSFASVKNELDAIKETNIKSIYDKFLPQDAEAAAALLGETEEGIKRTISLLEAQGAVDGELYQATKKRLEEEKHLLREQNRELEKQKETLDKLLGVNQSAQGAGSGFNDVPLINKIKTFFSTSNSAERETQRDLIAKEIMNSTLPAKVQNELIIALKKAAEDGANITDVLLQTEKNLRAARFDLTQQIKTNVQEQTNKDVEFQARQIEMMRVLDLKLKEELKAGDEKYQQDRLALRERTETVIEQQINKSRTAELATLDRQLNEERKKYELDVQGRIKAQEVEQKDGTKRTIDIEADFQKKRVQINRDADMRISEEKRKYRIEEYQQQVQFNQQMLATELSAINQQIQLLSGIDLSARIDLMNEAADKELQIQQQKNSDAYTAQVAALEKRIAEQEAAGETETENYKRTLDTLYKLFLDYNTREEQARTDANNKKIRNIQKGYADVINVINQETQDLNAAVERQNAQALFDISEPGGAGLFGRDFENKRQGLRNRRNRANVAISQAREALPAAQETLTKATEAAKNATAETQAAADEALIKAETTVNQLQTNILTGQKEVNDTTRDLIKMQVVMYIDMYTQIAQAAQQGYNQIAEIRQRDIQREIDVRESRMSAAIELAKMGNTQILDNERNALKQAQKERRQAALETQAINSALQFSYAALAVAKAAAEGGGIFSAATIAATVGALIAGYSAVRSATQIQQTEGFKDGVVDYQGKGTAKSDSNIVRISRGESVMTAEATAQYKDVLRAMNAGVPIPRMPLQMLDANMYAGNKSAEVVSAVNGVRDEVRANKVQVTQKMDKNGVAQAVETYRRLERRKWQ